MKNRFYLILFVLLIVTSKTKAQRKVDTLQKLPRLNLLNHQKVMKKLFGKPRIEIKTLGILVYDGFDAMETVAPMVVLSELMNVKVEYIGVSRKGKIKGDLLEMQVDKTLRDIKQLDFLLIPGADGSVMQHLMENDTLLSWITTINAQTKLTAATGYGVLLLAKTGALNGKKAACNSYKGQENLSLYGAEFSPARYLNDGKYYTAQASTATIDLMLYLIHSLYGNNYTQAAMLDLEYDPHPPFPFKPIDEKYMKAFEPLKTKDGLQLTRPNSKPSATDTIGIVVYDGVFTLDAIGPLCVLSQAPGVYVQLIGSKAGVVKSGRTKLYTAKEYKQVNRLDGLVLPGGSLGTWQMAQDSALRQWILMIDKQTDYTSSVCTGAWILGEAGLLKNREATTHWYRKNEMLIRYGATPLHTRYVNSGKYWTSAGVSAGIDFSLALLKDRYGEVVAENASRILCYNPQPVIPGGVPAKSNPLVVDMMQQMYDYMMLKELNKTK